MRKVDVDLVKRARSGDQDAIFEIYSKYTVKIGKFAHEIYERYHVDSLEEIVNRGFDGLADAIMDCDISSDNDTYFSAIVDNYVVHSMFGKTWYEIKKAVSEVERIYDKKYICTDYDMTEDIVLRLKPPYGSLIKNNSYGKKEEVIEKMVRNKLKEYYPVSYDDMRNVTLPVDTSSGDKPDYKKEITQLNYAFQLITPRQEAYIRLRYGIFEKKVYSDDEISRLLMIPVSEIEFIQRKKMNGEELNKCEEAILNLKKGIVSDKVISYVDMSKVYNKTYQSIEFSVSKGIRILRIGIEDKNIDLKNIKNVRRK